MFLLPASILVQQYLLKAPFAQYAAETICFLGISFYMVIRYIMRGLNIYGDGRRAKSILLLYAFVAGIAVTVVNGVLNYMQYIDRYRADGIGGFMAVLAVTFISAILCCLALLAFFGYLNKRKQEKLQRQLDEEELV